MLFCFFLEVSFYICTCSRLPPSVVLFAEASGAQEAEPQPLKEAEPWLLNEVEPRPLPNPPYVLVLDSPFSCIPCELLPCSAIHEPAHPIGSLYAFFTPAALVSI